MISGALMVVGALDGVYDLFSDGRPAARWILPSSP